MKVVVVEAGADSKACRRSRANQCVENRGTGVAIQTKTGGQE